MRLRHDSSCRPIFAVNQLNEFYHDNFMPSKSKKRRRSSSVFESSSKLFSQLSDSNIKIIEREQHSKLLLPLTQQRLSAAYADAVAVAADDESCLRNIQFVMAPMVAASDYAFRCLCRQYTHSAVLQSQVTSSRNHDRYENHSRYQHESHIGNPILDINSDTSNNDDATEASSNTLLTFSQMLHARNVVQDRTFRRQHFDFYEHSHGDIRASFSSSSLLSFEVQKPLVAAQQQLIHDLPTDVNELFVSTTSSKDEVDCVSFDQHYHHRQDIMSPTNGPLIVQLAGNDVPTVLTAAHTILDGSHSDNVSPSITGFDLNLGCPQGIARKGHYGAYLMEENPSRVCQILSTLRSQLPSHVSVSAKIRLPTTSQNNDALLQQRITQLLDTGIDFLTVHGRTLHENKATVGACHVDQIRQAVDHAHAHTPNFPIIANGGIEFPSDVKHMQEMTGAAAVMSSEALLECPDLFARSIIGNNNDSFTSPEIVFHRQFGAARDYISWCCRYPPLPGVLGPRSGSWNVVKGHIFKLLHRYLQEHPDIRDRLADCHIGTLRYAFDIVKELLVRYRPYIDGYRDWNTLSSSSVESSWYRRHRTATAEQRVPSQVRFSAIPLSSLDLSLDERKMQLKKRIANLQRLREEKEQSSRRLCRD
jgi:tRNA-dihydrouridine synthase